MPQLSLLTPSSDYHPLPHAWDDLIDTLAALRGLGLAARYVSGYLETTPPVGMPRQLGADAWGRVWLPGLGWFDFDPTNGIAADEGHLTLAWGRDFGDVTPLKGVIHGGGTHTLEVAVTVTRLDDQP